jgi:sporulation protein YlmC with PRC-barrel domain
MFLKDQITRVKGTDVFSTVDGAKIGKAGEVYLDSESGEPQWIGVHTGLFGLNENVIPTSHAVLTETGIEVPYTKEQVTDAPNFDPDSPLKAAQEQRLYNHFGLNDDYATWAGPQGGAVRRGIEAVRLQRWIARDKG